MRIANPSPLENKATESTASDHRWSVSPSIAILLLVGLVVVLYYPGVRAPFVFDDENQIGFNQNLRHWARPASYWHEARPFGFFTLALNYAWGKLNPFGYRFVNICIHAAAGCVLYDLVRRLLSLPQFAERYGTRASELALVVAALWLAHPLQTASVTYVIQRFESLMGLLFLLAIYAFFRGTQATEQKYWWPLAVIAGILSGATKEVAAVLPLVALLFDRAFLAGDWLTVGKKRWAWHLSFWTAPLTAIVITVHALSVRSDVSAGFGLKSVTPWEYLRSQPLVLLHYLKLTVWPDQLVLDYGWPVTPAEDSLRIFGGGGLILAMLFGGLYLYRKQPPLGFLILTWFIILAPTSSFLPIADLCFEHRIYLSLAATIALGVLLVDYLVSEYLLASSHRGIVLATLVLIALLGMRTIRRNTDYLSPLKLWTQAAEYNPRNSRALNNAAKELARIPGRENEAIARYQQAIAVQPQSGMFPDNLGNILARQGEFEQAIPWYQQGVASEATYLPARLHLCSALLLTHRAAEAWQTINETPATLTRHPEIIKQKAWLRALAEDEAIRSGSEALKLLAPLIKRDANYRDALLRDLHAIALAAAGDFPAAAKLAEASQEYYENTRQTNLAKLAQKRLARFSADQPWTIALELEHLQDSRGGMKSLPASELLQD